MNEVKQIAVRELHHSELEFMCIGRHEANEELALSIL